MPNDHPSLNNVYVCARFSTRKQCLGDSERRQQKNAENWGKEHGCKITYFVDPGISARYGKIERSDSSVPYPADFEPENWASPHSADRAL